MEEESQLFLLRAHHHHHRSQTRLSTPPPAQPLPSSSSNPRRSSPHFDPPRRQSYPSSNFAAHVSWRHSLLLDSLSTHSPLRESQYESDFRGECSPASASRRQISPVYTGRRQSPLPDSTISKQSPIHEFESESDFTPAAASHKSPALEHPRSDLPVLPSDESKYTRTETIFALANEKRKGSKIFIRISKYKLEETTPDEDQDKSTPPESAFADVTGDDEESVPKTWNLRPRSAINKKSNGNGNGVAHKHGGSSSKELRSFMNIEPVGINRIKAFQEAKEEN